MSGVTIIQGFGAPDNPSNSVQIRGVGSFGASPTALVLVDGIPGSLADINPAEIESISVLKDASTAAIYGARAANGVILITTKSGKEGKVQVSYNGYVGFNRLTEPFETFRNNVVSVEEVTVREAAIYVFSLILHL